MQTEKTPFWVVWNPATRYVGVKHPTQEEAEIEANRLASVHRGDEFVVLKSICSFRANTVVRTVHEYVSKSYALSNYRLSEDTNS